MIFDEAGKREIYTSSVRQALSNVNTFELYRSIFAQTDAVHPLDRMLYVDTRFYLPNDMLVKLDRMTMAHSLEARVPFLDHEMVEFAASLPPQLKLKQWRIKKYLLKKSLYRHIALPSVWRRKQGFNLPKGMWLIDELRDFAFDHLSNRQIHNMGMFKANQINRLLNEHVSGVQDHSHQIWGLLCLSLWWQQFMSETMKVSSPKVAM